VRELVEARGYSLLFLPAHSPNFSPIEEASSKPKALRRRMRARIARRSWDSSHQRMLLKPLTDV
jgi:hypothetical protein